MTPADVCDAIVYCNAIAWGKVGAVVAALATHVWRRHVDCVGRLRLPVPRPTDDAQVRADLTSSAERAQSSP